MKPYRGPPATLGSTAARYGADLAVRAWVKRLKCPSERACLAPPGSRCGSRSVDFVLTGARR